MECNSMASQIRALKLSFAKLRRVKGRTFRSAHVHTTATSLVIDFLTDCRGVFLLEFLSLASD